MMQQSKNDPDGVVKLSKGIWALAGMLGVAGLAFMGSATWYLFFVFVRWMNGTALRVQGTIIGSLVLVSGLILTLVALSLPSRLTKSVLDGRNAREERDWELEKLKLMGGRVPKKVAKVATEEPSAETKGDAGRKLIAVKEISSDETERKAKQVARKNRRTTTNAHMTAFKHRKPASGTEGNVPPEQG